MRVLHICLDHPPRRTRYGSGTVADDLLPAQQAAGHEIVVLTPGRAERQSGSGATRVVEVPIELTERYIRPLGESGTMFTAPSGAARWNNDAELWFKSEQPLGTWRADIVHNDGWATQPLAEAAAAECGSPLVTTAHVIEQHYIAVPGLGPAAGADQIRRSEEQVFRKSDVVIVPSTTARDIAAHYLPAFAGKLQVVPHGLNWATVGSAVRGHEPSGTDEVRVVYVGRISRERGWAPFLEAFTAAQAREPTMTLTAIGDGIGQQHTAAGSVRFLGGRSREETLLEVASADIFSNPALVETFGVAELEALGLGVCVASNGGFAKHTHVQHNETGVVIPLIGPPANPQLDIGAWTACLLHLARNPSLRHHLAERGRDTIRTMHDIDRMVCALDTVYDDARSIAGRRRSPGQISTSALPP